MTLEDKSPSVLETILRWSTDRPAWQRDALRRIISNGSVCDADLAEILTLCRKEYGGDNIEAQAEPLAPHHLPANPGEDFPVRLISVADVRGVNQLAPQQTLQCEPEGLTIVYGPNGAGKSGYARLLKRACRARHAGEIMPDAFGTATSTKAQARFMITVGDTHQPPIDWKDGGGPHEVLSAISVFDRDCASVHIREQTEVAFRPFGLDIPDELAAASQKLKDRLTAERIALETGRNPLFNDPTWKATTSVGRFLSGLTPEVALDELRALGEVTAEERARRVRLAEDLQRDPRAAAAGHRLYADNIQRVRRTVEAALAAASDDTLGHLKACADGARQKRAAVKLAAEYAWQLSAIPGVGEPAWRVLWEAAKRYVESGANPAASFPPEDDAPCVLCQRPVDEAVRERLRSFDAFIREDAESQAADAELFFKNALHSFSKERISLSAVKATCRQIAVENQALARKVTRVLAAARLRRRVCRRAIEATGAMALPSWPESPVELLEGMEISLRRYADELAVSSDPVLRQKLRAELEELTDRESALALLPIAEAEVARLKSLSIVEKCLSAIATHSITRLGNEIADNVITPKMRDRFHAEIVKLAADRVRVECVRTGGRFGCPRYQVQFLANTQAKVHEVLSEGEQTCVALAAFLTELATASHMSALIFDDPVSSLDHRWRTGVAKRLVDETSERQVVVFTHDLVFVNDLRDMAEQKGVTTKTVTLNRGPAGAGIIEDGVSWIAAKVPERIDTLEKEARAARALYEMQDEDRYRDAVVRIYSRLRASWERAIEDVGFAGVVHRHRDYIATQNLRKVTVLTEADCAVLEAGFQKCCDFTDAHDPSRGRDGEVPPPNEIFQDIDQLKKWVDEIRAKHKKLG